MPNTIPTTLERWRYDDQDQCFDYEILETIPRDTDCWPVDIAKIRFIRNGAGIGFWAHNTLKRHSTPL